MRQQTRTKILALVLFATITTNAFAHEGDDHHTPPSMPSITVNAPSTSTSGANSEAAATASPIISPVINGGNSSATGGNASLQNTGNATLNGSNTLNGNVQGSVTGTNSGVFNNNGSQKTEVGVQSNNTNLNQIGINATGGNNTNSNTLNGGAQNQSIIDNSKTINNVQGGTTTATGTANVKVGDQVLNNTVKQGDINNQITTGAVKTSAEQQQSQSQKQGQGQSQTATGGDARQSNTLSNVGSPILNISNPKPLPPAAPIPSVQTEAPALFFNKGEPANAAAVRFAIEFLKQCPPTFDETDVSEIRGDGASGKTRVIFTPHSNYATFKKPDLAPRVSVVMTPEQLPAGKFKCMCLGLLQVEAYTSDASDVAFQTIVNNAGIFARDKMRGYADVKLVLIPAYSVSVNMGADATARGFGLAPGFSGLLNTFLTTIGGNLSSNTGRTFPAAQIGATFAVVAGGDIPDGAASIDLGAFMDALAIVPLK